MRNIHILEHFDEIADASGITIFRLREDERQLFFSKLPQPYRCLYLTDEDLEWRLQTFAGERSDEIKEKIPDDPVIMSGEFAEILCYYLIPERNLPNSQLRPPKWKWKEGKNIPAHFTDVILFHQQDQNNPSPNDSLISIESKARATRPGPTESALQKAISDARKDYVSRLGESLFHLKTRYKDDKNAAAVRQLERFSDSVRYPTYSKHFKAIAVVDDSYADTHVLNIGEIPTNIRDTFEVILVRINNLKLGYESTFIEMANT